MYHVVLFKGVRHIVATDQLPKDESQHNEYEVAVKHVNYQNAIDDIKRGTRELVAHLTNVYTPDWSCNHIAYHVTCEADRIYRNIDEGDDT